MAPLSCWLSWTDVGSYFTVATPNEDVKKYITGDWDFPRPFKNIDFDDDVQLHFFLKAKKLKPVKGRKKENYFLQVQCVLAERPLIKRLSCRRHLQRLHSWTAVPAPWCEP